MRNSTLALTAVIAVLAGGLAWAVSRPDQVQSLLKRPGVEQTATETTPNSEVKGELTDAQNAAVTPPNPPVSETPPATASSENQVDQATPAVTPVEASVAPEVTATTDADTAGGMTPVDLNKLPSETMNKETPASGAETASAPSVSDADFKVDVDAALADRSIGSPAAPLIVYDFSSLSCPHCAMFHNEILPQVKEHYIDTGKVRWVFKGFPLNEPALKAEMVARCAPDNRFIELEDFMYKNQQRWAFTDDPLPNLSLLLRISGITEKIFLDCVNSKDLETKLAGAIQANATKYGITSTPTFVFNDGKKKVVGAGSYKGFALDLDTMLKELGVEPPKQAATAMPTLEE